MIETILPRRASAPVAHPQYAVSAASRFEVARTAEFDANAETEEEDYELVSFEPGTEARKDFLEESEEIFGRPSAPVGTTSTEAREIFTPPESLATEMPLAFSSINQAHAVEEELPNFKQTSQSIAIPDVAQAETVGELKAAIDESAVDPWDDPLPAWEYSRNEWPIIVEAKKKSAFAKLRIPIAIGVLAALAIIAYFALKPPAEKPQEQISVATPELSEPLRPEAGDAAPGDAQTPATTPASNAVTTPAQTTPAQNAANDEGSAKWRYSLQAMASQNAEEAKQFVARLVGAGIPAYVVSADLGQRGKWHRVRVGNFITSEEATRFAVEARERARAAGVALRELNLCAYEKP